MADTTTTSHRRSHCRSAADDDDVGAVPIPWPAARWRRRLCCRLQQDMLLAPGAGGDFSQA